MAVLESPHRGRLIAAGLIIAGIALAAVAAWYLMTRAAPGPGAVPRSREVPGQGERVVVEVLNGSGEVGLARAATRHLRDAGLDVVYYGSDTTSGIDTTIVLVRRGTDDKAQRVRRALGTGLVRAAPDSARLVDVTVRLGRDFALLARDP